MKKLNLGCGYDIRNHWVNLDIAAVPGVDIIHDINQIPLPFEDGEMDYILCNDILEHVDYIPLMKDLHRILKDQGILEIRVPHFTSRNNFVDPTHIKMFSFQTFDFFVRKSIFFIEKSYYFEFHFESILFTKITFAKGLFFWDYLVEPLVNISNKTKKFYEKTFFSRLFPAHNILLKLKK